MIGVNADEAAAEVQEIAAVEAAICLESVLTRSSRQDDDGSYVVAIPDDEDGEAAQAALERIAAALPAGWSVMWTGAGNTSRDGFSTSYARVYRDDVDGDDSDEVDGDDSDEVAEVLDATEE